MAFTAADYFGRMIASYDSLIARAVPRYDEITARLVDYLPTGAERILELGCGTGNLSLALAARFPDARLTFVDAAPEMVELTQARLAESFPDLARRASPVLARFEALHPDPAAYDLVVSCFSLHHVIDLAPLYGSMRRALAPGGTLRFADQVKGGTPANEAVNRARWLAFCRLPGHCTEEELQSLLEHDAQHDHPVSLPEHFELLRAAGFEGVDCVWRDGGWGILTADVPDDRAR